MAKNEVQVPERELGTSYAIGKDGSVTFSGTPTDEEREAAYAAAREAAQEREAELDEERQAAIQAAEQVNAAALQGEGEVVDGETVTGDAPVELPTEREGAAAQLPRERGTVV